jgi:hypothetical protein
MNHQFINRSSFFGTNDGVGFAVASSSPRSPVFFVGIQRDNAPPLAFGRSRLQRMRVILVEPDEAVNLAGLYGDDDDSLPEVLPQLPAPPHHLALQPRLVQGEILRGENGEFFEKIGGRIRRLSRLVSGPGGEILDIVDFGSPAGSQQRGSTAPPPTENVKTASKPAPAEIDLAPSHFPPSFRALFPGPGQWRIVRFGDYKQMFVPQLAHPERLRDEHRLPCYVQVYEATVPQRWEASATAILGDRNSLGALQPLTPAVLMHLQLAPLLQAPAQRPTRREPGLILPNDRLFRLQLADDPTVEASESPETHGAAEPSLAVPIRRNDVPEATALKTSVPERFLRPWEFKISREEALYDLNCAGLLASFVVAFLRRLKNSFGFRREVRKWQVLLSGKSVDEQLWTVRPPRGGLRHPIIRRWAKSALELGSYDPRNMLTEWEIFWRRKGF